MCSIKHSTLNRPDGSVREHNQDTPFTTLEPFLGQVKVRRQPHFWRTSAQRYGSGWERRSGLRCRRHYTYSAGGHVMQQRARHPRLSWLATIIAIPVLLLFGVLSARAQGSASTSVASSQGLASPAFTVSFGPGVRSTPVTGRLFVIISRTGNPAPRLQADQGGVTDTVPFWGEDVTGMRPGQSVVLGGGPRVYGYPLTSLARLPAGHYWVQ